MYLKSMLLIKGTNPGKLLVDFDSHKVELKARIANQYPYKEWLDNHKVDLNLEGQTYHQPLLNSETLFELRQFDIRKKISINIWSISKR